MLIVLVIRTSVPCVLFCGASFLGEVSQEISVTLPVATGMLHYITAHPLIDGYISCSCAFEWGNTLCCSRNVNVWEWKNNVYEVELTPQSCVVDLKYNPGALQRHAFDDGSIATLYISQAGGVHIALELGDELLYSTFICHNGEARFYYNRFDTCETITVIYDDGCKIIRKDEKCECIMDKKGLFDVDNTTIIGVEELGSFAGYVKRSEFDIKTAQCKKSAVIKRKSTNEIVQEPEHTCACLLEAVQFGVESDIHKIVSGELQSMPLQALAAYFGSYQTLRLPPVSPTGTVVGVTNSTGYCKMRLIGFECEQKNGGWTVVNAFDIP